MARVPGIEWVQQKLSEITATSLGAATEAEMTAVEGRATSLESGKADLNHATRHATGGADPITPESIGAAVDTSLGVYPSGVHVDTVVDVSGSYWVSGDATPANGFPASTPSGYGVLTVDRANGSTYVTQTLVSHWRADFPTTVWTRASRGGNWTAWTPERPDQQHRLPRRCPRCPSRH